IANDGSSDCTIDILKSIASTNAHISYYDSPSNVGKANVIFSAYQHLKSKNLVKEYEWIGFWDADLATPLDTPAMMIDFLRFYPNEIIDSIWCSRVARLGSVIKRRSHRHYLGRIFVTIATIVLEVKAYDSQCGAKLFRPKTAD